MAVNLVSPGILTREVDLTLGRIQTTNVNVGVIAGPFEKGPINQPILIKSEKELLSIFGKPVTKDFQSEYWLSAASYLSYGGHLRVIRTSSTELRNANIGVSTANVSSLVINSKDDFEINYPDVSNWYFASRNAGSWANKVKVCVIDNFADQIISGINTTSLVSIGVTVGYGVTQSLSGRTVNVGTSVTTYTTEYIRGLITGIGNSEIYIKITDMISPNTGISSPIEYKIPGSTSGNAYSFVGTGTTINIVNSSGITTATLTSATVSDWYNQQTLGLTNSTVYWKNIANKPGTSTYAADRNSKNDELHVVVIDDSGSVSGIVGNLLEKFTFLTKSTDGKSIPSENIYYKNYLTNNSNYIYPGKVLYSSAPSKLIPTVGNVSQFTTTTGNWGQETSNIAFAPVGSISYSLTGGVDYSGVGGYSATLSNIISSYQVVLDKPELNINYLIGGPSGITKYESQSKANSILAIAESRKDCVAVISPFRGSVIGNSNSDVQTADIIDFFEGVQSSSYGILDSGYKYVFDRFNNKFEYIPCNADVAGLLARTASERYPWFSPAGTSRGSLKNAIKLAYNPNNSQRDDLYTKRINPIITTKDSGIILFGDKTALSSSSAFDRINVRQLFLVLEDTIENSARQQLFEFNDEITRINFVNIIDPYLRDVQSKRGITEYLIVCDESNNTPEIIDNNEFKADIYVKPARSINFIGLTFVATRTGLNFSEVVGTV